MKKILILIFIFFFLTGCSSYTELSDLSIVNTLGIDYQDNKYLLSMNVVDGKLDDSTIEKDLTNYSSKMETLNGAFNDIYLKSIKRLYLSHIDILVLTEDAINEVFLDIIKNFLENNEYRNNFTVVLLKDMDLEEFMNKKIISEDINNLLKTNNKETGITVLKDFETIMKELLIDKNTYLPTISYQDDKLLLSGYTLINNYKIYEELTTKESILLNLLSNKINKAYLNQTNIYDNQTIITTNKNNIDIKFLITTDNNYQKFLKDTKEDIISFLNKFHKQNYDILKLKERIRKNDYSYYKKTDNLLSKLNINISFDIMIQENYLKGGYYETE